MNQDNVQKEYFASSKEIAEHFPTPHFSSTEMYTSVQRRRKLTGIGSVAVVMLCLGVGVSTISLNRSYDSEQIVVAGDKHVVGISDTTPLPVYPTMALPVQSTCSTDWEKIAVLPDEVQQNLLTDDDFRLDSAVIGEKSEMYMRTTYYDSKIIVITVVLMKGDILTKDDKQIGFIRIDPLEIVNESSAPTKYRKVADTDSVVMPMVRGVEDDAVFLGDQEIAAFRKADVNRCLYEGDNVVKVGGFVATDLLEKPNLRVQLVNRKTGEVLDELNVESSLRGYFDLVGIEKNGKLSNTEDPFEAYKLRIINTISGDLVEEQVFLANPPLPSPWTTAYFPILPITDTTVSVLS